MIPIDVPTRETAVFVASNLPEGCSVLEVGCGAGHVARRLLDGGYAVTAIDADSVAVAEARERGVAARFATWPEDADETVDAIVFTRSLHHVDRLEDAVLAARRRLAPGGTLLVEDFAYHDATRLALEWLVGVLRSRTARALVLPVPGETATRLLAARDPFTAWRENHGEHFHRFEEMRAALARHFELRATSDAPYLYRYLVPVLPETAASGAFLDDVLTDERRLDANSGALIGRRVVASHRMQES